MVLDYLSVKNKYYLNGFDWVMGVLDLNMKKTTCAGNASQFVLVLDSPIDEAAFRESMARFLAEFPVVAGRVSRHYTLTPYWKVPRGNGAPALNLTVTRVDGDPAGALKALAHQINTPFRNEQEHLAFRLVYGRGEQYLAVTFDHRLFDARGAESFLALYQEYLASNGDARRVLNVCLTRGFDLTQWKHKFLSGRTVNRRMMACSREPVRALPVSVNGGPPGYKYRILSFDQEETKRIVDRAYEQAGYLMITPYLFACVTEGVHRVFERRGAPAGAYVVPVSTDLRRAKDIREELFFNHTSMFLFQLKPEDVVDRKRLVATIRSQMYEQVKVDFPGSLMAASALTRIAPLSLLRKVFHLPLKGKLASFCFSHVSKESLISPELMGAKITNLFHMPRGPVPPGIGVFFNSFRGRLNAAISYLDGLFADAEMEELERDLRSSI